MRYTVIMPVKSDDLHLVKANYKRIMEFIDVEKIIVITNTSNLSEISDLGPEVAFLDENTMYGGLSYSAAKEVMKKAGLDSGLTGHCFQQLLKMAFCYVNSGEGYLVWDADTLPIRKMTFYNAKIEKYIFYMKTEYVKTYFDHLFKLLHIKKQINKSFISEHMYIQNDIMREIIELIDNNNEVVGNTWWEKVIYAMDCGNGMSEYEIYGNYVLFKYPEKYEMRDALSLRFGRNVLGSNPSEDQIDWMSKEYEAISIESFDRETFLTGLSKVALVWRINPKLYANIISFLNRGINKVRRMIG